MPKRGRKRNSSPSQASGSKLKRPRQAPASSAPDPEDVIVIDSDSKTESDDLKAILAQIKAQEESERLVHRMQYEFDQPSTSGSKDTESRLEDDEAMAKRLAEEWAQEDESTNLEKRVDDFPMDVSDIEEVPGSHDASISSSSLLKGTRPLTETRTSADSSNPQGSSKSYISVPVRPDEGLTSFRHIFTNTRPCSKCGKDVQSPRGSVSDMMRFSIYVSLTQRLHDATGHFFLITFTANINAFASCPMYKMSYQSL